MRSNILFLCLVLALVQNFATFRLYIASGEKKDRSNTFPGGSQTGRGLSTIYSQRGKKGRSNTSPGGSQTGSDLGQ
jgi:hypothetical protein